MSDKARDYFNKRDKIADKYIGWLRDKIEQVHTTAYPPDTRIITVLLSALLDQIQFNKDELSYRTKTLAEDGESYKKSLDSSITSISILLETIVNLAKRVNAFESVRQDIDNIKEEQEKQRRMRESFEESRSKRAKEIEQQEKQSEERIKKGIPGIG